MDANGSGLNRGLIPVLFFCGGADDFFRAESV